MTAPRLAACRLDGGQPEHLARASRAALDRPMVAAAELIVATLASGACVLGAWQRACEVPRGAIGMAPVVVRGSGGAAVRVGPGTVWVQLLLERADALTACTPDRLVNRHVRPLLAALATSHSRARYYGRDWLSVDSRPVGSVTFAHEASTGRALFEAFVAHSTPFAVDPARASFRGSAPATLREIGAAAAPDDVAALADRIFERYVAAFGPEAAGLDPDALGHALAAPSDARDEPWTEEARDAIGRVAASRDRDGALRVGGEWLASRDGVAALERALAGRAALAVDEARDLAASSLGAGDRVVDGLASLDALAGVIARASAPRA